MTAPYYQDDWVTLYLGDWREEIAPDFRADLQCTDPPYGETSLAWDRWPVGWPDRLRHDARGWRGGFGIVLDDLVAAFCTLLVIALWRTWG